MGMGKQSDSRDIQKVKINTTLIIWMQWCAGQCLTAAFFLKKEKRNALLWSICQFLWLKTNSQPAVTELGTGKKHAQPGPAPLPAYETWDEGRPRKFETFPGLGTWAKQEMQGGGWGVVNCSYRVLFETQWEEPTAFIVKMSSRQLDIWVLNTAEKNLAGHYS